MMFDQLIECSVNKKPTDKSWTVVISAVLQVGIVFIFVLIPLLFTDALPNAAVRMFLIATPRAAAAPRPPSGLPSSRPASQIVHQGQIVTPLAIPRTINLDNDETLAPDLTTAGPGGDTNGVPGGEPDGLPDGIPGAVGTDTPPPPPATPVQHRIRVGGQVQAAKMLREVQPVYPQIAETARILLNAVLH